MINTWSQSDTAPIAKTQGAEADRLAETCFTPLRQSSTAQEVQPWLLEAYSYNPEAENKENEGIGYRHIKMWYAHSILCSVEKVYEYITE